MIRKIRLPSVPYINRNTKKRWPLVPEQAMKRSLAKKVPQAFRVKILTSNDKECAIDFIKRFFLPDEPLARTVKLLDGPNDRCTELEEYVSHAMDDQISVAAVDDKGKFVGLIINSLLLRNKDVAGDIEACANPKFKSILRVLVHLDTQSHVWEKVPSTCNILVDLKIASTDPNLRRQNIMKMLVKETESLAKKSGACGVQTNVTSKFSIRAVQKFGYKKIYGILYSKIPDGPQPEAPHHEACVYLKLF